MKKLTVLAGSLIALGVSGAAVAQNAGSNVSPTADVEEPRSLDLRSSRGGPDAAGGVSGESFPPGGSIEFPPPVGVKLPVIGGGDGPGDGEDDPGDDDDQTTPPPPAQPGGPIDGIDLGPGEQLIVERVVPGGDVLSITTSGGSGDVSLYVSRGSVPTPRTAEWSSERPGNNETVRIPAPVPGTYQILIVAERASRNFKLRVRQGGVDL